MAQASAIATCAAFAFAVLFARVLFGPGDFDEEHRSTGALLLLNTHSTEDALVVGLPNSLVTISLVRLIWALG